MKNKIEDLRNHLFETLEALKDKDDPMELDRARAISEVAQKITDTARVEVEYLKTVGGESRSGFLPTENDRALPAGNDRPHLVKNR